MSCISIFNCQPSRHHVTHIHINIDLAFLPMASKASSSVHIEPMPLEGVRVSIEAPRDIKGKGKPDGFRYAGFVAGIASVRTLRWMAK